MNELDWDYCELSGHLVSVGGDWCVSEINGEYHLEKKTFWDGFIPIGTYATEEAAKERAELEESNVA
jgi:hypothetical protein